mgnify:CR=1 FL=1
MTMTKRMLTLTCLAVLAALVLAAPAFAQTQTETVKQVDNFIFFVDHSGSMNMAYPPLGEDKIVAAKATADDITDEVPKLDYQSGVYTFAPFAGYEMPGAYNEAKVDQATDSISTDYDIFNRRTPLGNGLLDLDPVLQGLSGKTAVIIFTDGRNNLGRDPVAEAKALYAKYGNDLCIHVVSYADDAKGQMVIDQIRAISSCSVPADGAGLKDKATLAAFVEDVFYDTRTVAMPEPEPQPVVEETVITFRLNFGFDKYQITDEMVPILEQVKEILMQNQSVKVELAGHTDSIGTVEYNQGLSERRAGSVRDWLVDNGVPADRMKAVGYGELQPKYDNNTAEGRALNRRVEIHNM